MGWLRSTANKLNVNEKKKTGMKNCIHWYEYEKNILFPY